MEASEKKVTDALDSDSLEKEAVETNVHPAEEFDPDVAAKRDAKDIVGKYAQQIRDAIAAGKIGKDGLPVS